jgi:hypothetical protein
MKIPKPNRRRKNGRVSPPVEEDEVSLGAGSSPKLPSDGQRVFVGCLQADNWCAQARGTALLPSLRPTGKEEDRSDHAQGSSLREHAHGGPASLGGTAHTACIGRPRLALHPQSGAHAPGLRHPGAFVGGAPPCQNPSASGSIAEFCDGSVPQGAAPLRASSAPQPLEEAVARRGSPPSP